MVPDARNVGLKWRSLQTKDWRRLSRGQYSWTAIPDDTELRLRAAEQRLPAGFAFSGRTAAWILGLDMSPCDPIEATVQRGISVRSRAGMKVRRAALPESDVIQRRGFPVTNPVRTVTDLGSGKDLVESVVAIDMALQAGLIGMGVLVGHIENHAGGKGIRRLRRAVGLADSRSESPMETRLRVQLVCARLPTPELQVELHDKTGRFLGRADLYYSDVRLVVEFDGQNHKDRLAADLRRQNAILTAGYHILRFTAADLHVRGSVAAQVRRARDLFR
jgi:very-short-patch-repair endonuclease